MKKYLIGFGVGALLVGIGFMSYNLVDFAKDKSTDVKVEEKVKSETAKKEKEESKEVKNENKEETSTSEENSFEGEMLYVKDLEGFIPSYKKLIEDLEGEPTYVNSFKRDDWQMFVDLYEWDTMRVYVGPLGGVVGLEIEQRTYGDKFRGHVNEECSITEESNATFVYNLRDYN